MDSRPSTPTSRARLLRLDDVNGDGLDDLVQVRFDAVDVWLNVDGTGWTERHIIDGTPASPSFANRVRLVDINGSAPATCSGATPTTTSTSICRAASSPAS